MQVTTKPSNTFEATEPDTESTLTREPMQSYRVEVHSVSESVVSQIRGYTYGSVGTYFVRGGVGGSVVQTKFDTVFEYLKETRAPESSFERFEGEGYEVIVELVDDPVENEVLESDLTSMTCTISGTSDCGLLFDEALFWLGRELGSRV